MSRIYKNMLAPSPIAGPQTYSLDTPNSDPTMSAAKRARAEDVPYAEVDAEKLSLKTRKERPAKTRTAASTLTSPTRTATSRI